MCTISQRITKVENKHIHRFLEGRPTPDEINALHKQLSEDPGSIIREMEQDWDMDNSSADFDSEKHWKVLENHLNASISPGSTVRYSTGWQGSQHQF
jgi:arsenate reductase-like glutaredoxin family protein